MISLPQKASDLDRRPDAFFFAFKEFEVLYDILLNDAVFNAPYHRNSHPF